MKTISKDYREYLTKIISLIKEKPQFKKMKKHTISYNDNTFDLDIKTYRTSVYIIIDGIYALFINRDNVIGAVSVIDTKLWYSYDTHEDYTGIDTIRDGDNFIKLIKGLI